MMSFYSTLSKHYDQLFPLNESLVSFVKRHHRGGELLDVGCGTGSFALAMCDTNTPVMACDPDEEMINIARGKKILDNAAAPDFFVGDMLSVSKASYHDRFSTITCLGNTLPHLDNATQLDIFLNGVSRLLTQKGTLVLQLLNYDFILKSKPAQLAPIQRNEFSFERFYDYPADKVQFTSVLKVPGQKPVSSSIFLSPFTYHEIVAELTKVGFSDIRLFGDLNGADFNPDKLPLIIVATK